MTVLGFIGGSHCGAGHADSLRDAGAALMFDDMRQLPGCGFARDCGSCGESRIVRNRLSFAAGLPAKRWIFAVLPIFEPAAPLAPLTPASRFHEHRRASCISSPTAVR